MEQSLADFSVTDSQTCLDALRKIDSNRRGFVVVTDCRGRVIGTLTDGDIRRALLEAPENPIASISVRFAASRDFVSVPTSSRLGDLVDLFKDARINFLPILNSDGGLAGIITKKQLYGILLQCKELPDLESLLSVDESLIDYEIYQRPWGIYKTIVLQDRYQAKVIQVNPGGKLSLQYHLHREEHWVVASGIGEVQIGNSVVPAYPGSMFFIPRSCQHRLTNTSNS